MDRKTMLTRLRDAIGGAADKLSLRLPNGWTVTGYLFDRDYDPTRIPEGWTVDGILIDHDSPGNETLTLGNTFALFMV